MRLLLLAADLLLGIIAAPLSWYADLGRDPASAGRMYSFLDGRIGRRG